MASSFHFIALCSLLFISVSFAKTSLFKPKALLLPVTKDPSTLQYLTHIKQRTPFVSLLLTVDLGGKYLWTDCEHGYVSSTYQYYTCETPQCKLARVDSFCNTCDGPPGPSCHNNTCSHFPENSVTRNGISGDLTSDIVSIQSTDGKNPTGVVFVPEFFFFCTKTSLLEGLASGVKGIAGLGRTHLSLASQFPRFFDYRKIFAICLSPSKGVIILGDGPYTFLPNVNAASSLIYTPLIVNRGSWIEQPSSDYFIGVTSIKINGKIVPINDTLLSFDNEGNGGTKISTVEYPYTVLEPSVYDAFVNAFVEAASNFTRVAPVTPFEVCYSSKNIGSTHVGPAVPAIDFVLQSEEVYWRVFGANSMVQVSKDVMCLGFLKLRLRFPWHAITIGGYQLENNLLQFNVAKSSLGFSSSLLLRQTACVNFNFTSATQLSSVFLV